MLVYQRVIIPFTIWLLNVAMDNDHFEEVNTLCLSSANMGFSVFMLDNQRVYLHNYKTPMVYSHNHAIIIQFISNTIRTNQMIQYIYIYIHTYIYIYI